MLVKMLATRATPDGVSHAGSEVDVPAPTARHLVAKGYAEALEPFPLGLVRETGTIMHNLIETATTDRPRKRTRERIPTEPRDDGPAADRADQPGDGEESPES